MDPSETGHRTTQSQFFHQLGLGVVELGRNKRIGRGSEMQNIIEVVEDINNLEKHKEVNKSQKKKQVIMYS